MGSIYAMYVRDMLVNAIQVEIMYDEIYGPCWRCEGMGV